MQKHMVAIFALVALIFGVSFVPSQAAQQDIVQVSQAQRQADAQIILSEINKYRASLGVAPVKYSDTLSQIVQKESDRQVIEETFYHTDNFLTDIRAGNWRSANEVIALSYGRDVSSLVEWWKGSPAHEQAIRDPRHTVIGVGITYADGSLMNTGQGWQVLATVNLYGYNSGNEPSDTLNAVGSVTVPIPSQVTPTYTTKGSIGMRYLASGGAAVVGQPVMNEKCGLIGGGCYQEFSLNGKKSIIMWSPRTGSALIKYNGAIGQKWIKAGRERGYGYPSTNEIRTATETYQRFSNGYVVHWASGRGSWVTR